MRDDKLNVWLNGSVTNPKGVIKTLTNLGGLNKNGFSGLAYCSIYFINENLVINMLPQEFSFAKLIKKVFHEIQPAVALQPFDKVLVRDTRMGYTEWRVDIFSHMKDTEYQCVGSIWQECIPFKGNEYLLGTTLSPKN